jgi:O-acetyl-ADP-ribose deacetylase (regulator of RNase III)
VIEVRRQDLVTADVECVLRSVGSTLEPLTAIGKAVAAAAGEGMVERFEQLGDLPVGGAAITPGGDLSASFIIHVSLQSHEEPVSADGVRKALRTGLGHACRMGIETLALPPLGTGAGNLDAEAAADVMCDVLHHHIRNEEYPREITVMVATEYELQAFVSRLESASGGVGEQAVD